MSHMCDIVPLGDILIVSFPFLEFYAAMCSVANFTAFQDHFKTLSVFHSLF